MQSLVVMFAAGDFGMLPGCVGDSGPLGLYGLLVLCRSWASVASWPSPADPGLMTSLMRWACFGMVVGGNAGLALFGALDRCRALSVGHLIGFCRVGDAGMLL